MVEAIKDMEQIKSILTELIPQINFDNYCTYEDEVFGEPNGYWSVLQVLYSKLEDVITDIAEVAPDYDTSDLQLISGFLSDLSEVKSLKEI